MSHSYKGTSITLTFLVQILVPEKSEEAVGHLMLRFTDASNPGFLFNPVYHQRIPADGVDHYMNAVWEQVRRHTTFPY